MLGGGEVFLLCTHLNFFVLLAKKKDFLFCTNALYNL